MSFLAFHAIAAARGDGLLPEFVEAMKRSQAAAMAAAASPGDVVPFPCPKPCNYRASLEAKVIPLPVGGRRATRS
jgi:hypothetical protein